MSMQNGRLTEKELQMIEEELLGGAEKGSSMKNRGRKAADRIGPLNRAFYIKIAGAAVLVILLILLFGSFQNLLKTAAMPEGQQDGALDGFAAMVEQQETGMKDTGLMEGENVIREEGDAAESKEGKNGDITASYHPSAAIQSAVQSDRLFQLGTEVYKLPVTVAEIENSGAVLSVLGRAVPEEDVLLSPMTRSGYITLDGANYQVELVNGESCSYRDLSVINIISEETQSGLYAFGGIHVGMEESLLPGDYSQIKVDDLTARTTYWYGSADGLGYGDFVKISCKGGKVVWLQIADR